MDVEAIIVAFIATVPPTIMALASWGSSRKVHAEIKTNHGLRAGEYLEMQTVLAEGQSRLGAAVSSIERNMASRWALEAHLKEDERFQTFITEKLGS